MGLKNLFGIILWARELNTVCIKKNSSFEPIGLETHIKINFN